MEIFSSIVGARFRPPAADVLNNLPMTTDLICVREPDNEHDHNAIKVMIHIDKVNVQDFLNAGQEPSDIFSIDEEGHYQLGYIPRDVAEILAPVLDKTGGRCPGVLGFNLEGRPQVSMEVAEAE